MRTTSRYFALLGFCLVSIAILYVINENIDSKRIAEQISIRKKLGLPMNLSDDKLNSQKKPRPAAEPVDHSRGGGGDSQPVAKVVDQAMMKAEQDMSKKFASGEGGITGSCTPKHNITFTKVHKSGSSTVQNILLRYGDRHNLKFVLPQIGHHLGYPNNFDSAKHMLHNSNELYNIFCHHARFTPDVLKIMPPNTVYISIVRDPVDVFESAFTYFKLDARMGIPDDTGALTTFLTDPKKYVIRMRSAVHTRNNMLYDFGTPMEDFDDVKKMQKTIDTISERFSLVLIGEYFEESLILLRDLLCWRTEDVVVFRLNSRNENSVQRLSHANRVRIKEWNMGDVLLYNQFNRSLHEKIDNFGRDKMAREVEKLKKLIDQYYKDCVWSNQARSQDADFKVWQPRGVQINGFILKESAKGNPVCARMIKPEIQYTEELRQKQFGINRRKNQRLKPAKKRYSRHNIM